MSAPALRLALAPSIRLAVAILALHAGAAACILAVLPGPGGSLLALAFIGLGLAATWSRALLRSSASVRGLEIAGASLALELASGEKLPAEVAGRRYVSRLAVTLPLRRPRRTILVTADMLPAADFRRLRIWALWGKLPGVAAAQLSA
ncbi:MAG TPA: protein YgfX [Burkholderiales bacterium]|nr:protein YgfX [Burkholderiales bacterium]